MLEHAVGRTVAQGFHVFAGDSVAAKKPAPDIYLLALEQLDVTAGDAVVIEDSANGLRAALAAGIPTVVTVSGYTRGEDFAGASLVVSSLGEPGGEVTSVLADAAGVRPGAYVTISDIDVVLAGARSGAGGSDSASGHERKHL